MMNERFSDTRNYVIEYFPKNVRFFEKKKWISQRLANNDQKILYYSDKKKFIWVILEEKEEFWMPFEKIAFFAKQFHFKKGKVLIIEERLNLFSESKLFYYAIMDKFLVSYGDDFEEAMAALKANGSGEVTIFGIGNEVDRRYRCDKILYYGQIAEKIGYKTSEVFTDELIYLREDHEKQEVEDINELFFYWFENKKCMTKKDKIINLSLIFGISVFVFGAFWSWFELNRTKVVCYDLQECAMKKNNCVYY